MSFRTVKGSAGGQTSYKFCRIVLNEQDSTRSMVEDVNKWLASFDANAQVGYVVDQCDCYYAC